MIFILSDRRASRGMTPNESVEVDLIKFVDKAHITAVTIEY